VSYTDFTTRKISLTPFQTSSLGAAKEEFISNIYRAAQGHNGSAELQRRNKKPIKVPPPKRSAKTFFTKVRAATTNAEEESTDDDSNFEEETKWNTIKEKFRVFFPSKDTVVASKGGVGCGGTICFQRKWWNDQTFPKALVRDCKSVRPGALMHNKVCTNALQGRIHADYCSYCLHVQGSR